MTEMKLKVNNYFYLVLISENYIGINKYNNYSVK